MKLLTLASRQWFAGKKKKMRALHVTLTDNTASQVDCNALP